MGLRKRLRDTAAGLLDDRRMDDAPLAEEWTHLPFSSPFDEPLTEIEKDRGGDLFSEAAEVASARYQSNRDMLGRVWDRFMGHSKEIREEYSALFRPGAVPAVGVASRGKAGAVASAQGSRSSSRSTGGRVYSYLLGINSMTIGSPAGITRTRSRMNEKSTSSEIEGRRNTFPVAIMENSSSRSSTIEDYDEKNERAVLEQIMHAYENRPNKQESHHFVNQPIDESRGTAPSYGAIITREYGVFVPRLRTLRVASTEGDYVTQSHTNTTDTGRTRMKSFSIVLSILAPARRSLQHNGEGFDDFQLRRLVARRRFRGMVAIAPVSSSTLDPSGDGGGPGPVNEFRSQLSAKVNLHDGHGEDSLQHEQASSSHHAPKFSLSSESKSMTTHEADPDHDEDYINNVAIEKSSSARLTKFQIRFSFQPVNQPHSQGRSSTSSAASASSSKRSGSSSTDISASFASTTSSGGASSSRTASSSAGPFPASSAREQNIEPENAYQVNAITIELAAEFDDPRLRPWAWQIDLFDRDRYVREPFDFP
ncbi:unnamed protein product [Amoebophrya sp. A25]|nr:unnamed protein product [Amoebophrya sp. A25]|eukprot:GSA25T00010201001.1